MIGITCDIKCLPIRVFLLCPGCCWWSHNGRTATYVKALNRAGRNSPGILAATYRSITSHHALWTSQPAMPLSGLDPPAEVRGYVHALVALADGRDAAHALPGGHGRHLDSVAAAAGGAATAAAAAGTGARARPGAAAAAVRGAAGRGTWGRRHGGDGEVRL